MSAFHLTVRLPEPLRNGGDGMIAVDEPVASLGELAPLLERRIEGFRADDELYNFAVNGEMILHGERATPLRSGDEVEILVSFSGG
ncbi:MAG TPA: MoaD/ThiS family protein [Thermoanaerobaculia bacterium]|nr:MoaD/ThiS family protein [Thermoanaerobaculia bacterium]